jgi:hypothetical protein
LRSDKVIGFDQVLTGHRDPHLVEDPTDRIATGLEAETESRGQATRDHDGLCIHIRGSGHATAKRGTTEEQRFALFGGEIVRSGAHDHVVAVILSIDAFTDKLLQETGHGAVRALESVP